MSKISKKISKRKIEISKELLTALENSRLPEDILEQIIDILALMQEAKRGEANSQDVVLIQTRISPEEMLGNTYNRLDGLIERTEDMKARVDSINLELQKLAYFG